MSEAIRETYIQGIEERFVPLVMEIDRAVMAACPMFHTAIKYKMLTYALAGDYRHWVCAIDVVKKGACLRFLYGERLADPNKVLRAGTGILRTIDIPSLEMVDAQLIGAYVTEAVALFEEFKAWSKEWDSQHRKKRAKDA